MSDAPDWQEWHQAYDDPESRLSRRLRVVQEQIRRDLAERNGIANIISMCSGEGRDILPVLAERNDNPPISALLVEADQRIADTARERARTLGLAGVTVLCADAALTRNYASAGPADLVLACGIFGNISDGDISRTIRILPRLCAADATVIWTRWRRKDADITPAIRGWFSEAGFEETAFIAAAGETFAVGVNRLVAEPRPLARHTRMFTFVSES